jgi:hypothetical protein
MAKSWKAETNYAETEQKIKPISKNIINLMLAF